MKKLLFLGVGSALMFTMGGVGSAQADNGNSPHSIVMGQNGTTTTVSAEGADKCASCHRAHTAQAQNMLKQAQPALCYNCHNGSLGSKLDVVDGVSNLNGEALRGGGFKNAYIDSGLGATKTLTTAGSRQSAQIGILGAAAPVTSTHQIDGNPPGTGNTPGTMWGNGSSGSGSGQTVTLECGACHDPHGNGNYRLLKPVPVGAGTAAKLATDGAAVPATYGLADATTGVRPVLTPGTAAKYLPGGIVPINIPDQPYSTVSGTPTKAYTTTNYWDVQAVGVPPTLDGVILPNVSEADPITGKKAVPVTDGFLGNVAAWCTTCHTRYLAGSGVANTGQSDPVFTYKHRSDEGASLKPNCIQCHVAHGTNAVMTGDAAPGTPGTSTSVTAPDGKALVAAPAAGDQSSDLLRVNNRGTCLMCHAVGAPNPLPARLP
jgi:predicted CXXCH cytochrome family protein